MKTKILYLFIALTLFLGIACNDYLELSPSDQPSDKMTWSKVEYAELVINNFYHDIHDYGVFGDGQVTAGLSEGFTDILKYGSMNYSTRMYIPNEIAYGGSALTASYVDVYIGNWSHAYQRIRRINQAISKLSKFGSMSEEDTNRLLAEMRFFRAFNYFELAKRYKRLIIYDEDLDQIQKDKALNTEAEVWEFIKNDLLFAGEHLPSSTSALGRVTKGAAYAFMSRAMLYAKKWEDAKNAAIKVNQEGYKLVSNYSDAFLGGDSNTESILQYSYNVTSRTHQFDAYYTPRGDENNQIGGGYATPTQEMVESFELKTGGFPDWSLWHNTDGVTTSPPYEDLEPRFHATILYNGATWKGRVIEPFVGGTDGYASWKDDPSPGGRSTTGYYLKKLVDENHSSFSERGYSTQPWIAIRYAEVLLNYAEACYNLEELGEANGALREIRKRVGLGYSDKSGDALMVAIRQERKVELAYEGQYYWDMRRWKLAEEAFSGIRVHGLKIVKIADGIFSYAYVDCDKEDRNFPSKMYQMPLPETELNTNLLLTQYLEWQ